MKKVSLEIHKEKFIKYFNLLNHFENLSYFKSNDSWVIDIYVSNLLDEKLIDIFFKVSFCHFFYDQPIYLMKRLAAPELP